MKWNSNQVLVFTAWVYVFHFCTESFYVFGLRHKSGESIILSFGRCHCQNFTQKGCLVSPLVGPCHFSENLKVVSLMNAPHVIRCFFSFVCLFTMYYLFSDEISSLPGIPTTPDTSINTTDGIVVEGKRSLFQSLVQV